ncbi:MAG: Hsp20/alpha crystallin family protein [Deltaproteobacteria bacterium]|nr:Hsp20/alpha crystallin family protein [Deltaproteobacteria bacterium]MBI3386335.1 Hsp20/alpha crystallin family protein [Deltaproteobacteria bacterium]
MTPQELSVRDKQETAREEHTRAGRTYLPDVDIYETTDALWLWADMPGVESAIDVHLADGMLSISGRVSVKEYAELAPVYTEYNVGNYVRRFTVSDAIDSDQITAKLNNGVLELKLPKAERVKPRRIAVATA